MGAANAGVMPEIVRNMSNGNTGNDSRITVLMENPAITGNQWVVQHGSRVYNKAYLDNPGVPNLFGNIVESVASPSDVSVLLYKDGFRPKTMVIACLNHGYETTLMLWVR